jgi:lipid-binding SYLF domain-containing protein
MKCEFGRRVAVLGLCFTIAAPLLAQKKEEERLQNSATAMKTILSENNGLPKSVLDQAVCVLIYPSVKKMGLGITGSSYGRGTLVCRKGEKMNGEWGAPAMYSLDRMSVGPQLGASDSDFVLVIMSQKGADQILSGKTKLGTDAAAAAGPTGAQATSYNAAAMKADVLTYSQSKGMFAGVSLGGSSMETDNDANKAIYGKEIAAKEIVTGKVSSPPAAQPLVALLDKTSPARK